MDNLCHTLVGAAMGEAGLKRRTGLAMATLMIGANLPDLDVLAIPFGESLAFRRGWTHGPLAWMVLPLALSAAVTAWDRGQARRGSRPADRPPVRAGEVLLLAFVGVLSHPFFDWLNTYGVRLLMPFAEEWFYGDAVFILDPWIWLALGAGVYLSRTRARAGHRMWTRPARLALVAVSLYVSVMVAGSMVAERLAIRRVEARTELRVRRIMAGPVPLDPFRRHLVYETDDAYGFGELVWKPRPVIRLRAGLLPKQEHHPAVRSAREAESMQDFLYWSRFPFFLVEESENGTWVRVADARYASAGGAGWATERVWVSRPK